MHRGWNSFYFSDAGSGSTLGGVFCLASQSGQAETGQVAEEDLRERTGKAEQLRTPGGKKAHTHS